MLPNIDHLVYTVADLGAGMDTIERLFGVRPVPGGRHPAFGTYNVLVSLGMETYLEIIAADAGYWSSHKDPATQSDSPETERSWPPPTVE